MVTSAGILKQEQRQQEQADALFDIIHGKEIAWNVSDDEQPEFYYYAAALALAYVVKKGSIDAIIRKQKSYDGYQQQMLTIFRDEIVFKLEKTTKNLKERVATMSFLARRLGETCISLVHNQFLLVRPSKD